MDAAQALADLTEISSQIQAAVVIDADGSALASTLDGPRSAELAGAAQELLAAAGRVSGEGGRKPAQLEVSTGDGCVFVVHISHCAVCDFSGPLIGSSLPSIHCANAAASRFSVCTGVPIAGLAPGQAIPEARQIPEAQAIANWPASL